MRQRRAAGPLSVTSAGLRRGLHPRLWLRRHDLQQRLPRLTLQHECPELRRVRRPAAWRGGLRSTQCAVHSCGSRLSGRQGSERGGWMLWRLRRSVAVPLLGAGGLSDARRIHLFGVRRSLHAKSVRAMSDERVFSQARASSKPRPLTATSRAQGTRCLRRIGVWVGPTARCSYGVAAALGCGLRLMFRAGENGSVGGSWGRAYPAWFDPR